MTRNILGSSWVLFLFWELTLKIKRPSPHKMKGMARLKGGIMINTIFIWPRCWFLKASRLDLSETGEEMRFVKSKITSHCNIPNFWNKKLWGFSLFNKWKSLSEVCHLLTCFIFLGNGKFLTAVGVWGEQEQRPAGYSSIYRWFIGRLCLSLCLWSYRKIFIEMRKACLFFGGRFTGI